MLRPLRNWVCFDCRKQFRRSARLDPFAPDGLELAAAPLPCTVCGCPTFDMGRAFRCPRRHNRRSWNQLRRLAEHGIRFHGTGMHAWIRYVRAHSPQTSWVDAVIANCACHDRPPGKVLLRAIAARGYTRRRRTREKGARHQLSR